MVVGDGHDGCDGSCLWSVHPTHTQARREEVDAYAVDASVLGCVPE